MSNRKTFFGRLIESFLNIFDSASRKLWESLDEQTQTDLKNGSGVLKIIGDNVDKAAEDVEAEIKAKYPDIPFDTIIELAEHFNLPVGDSVTSAISELQKWIASKEGSVWDNVMNVAAQTLSFFLSGKEAKPGIIAALAEKVYRWFIKDK